MHIFIPGVRLHLSRIDLGGGANMWLGACPLLLSLEAPRNGWLKALTKYPFMAPTDEIWRGNEVIVPLRSFFLFLVQCDFYTCRFWADVWAHCKDFVSYRMINDVGFWYATLVDAGLHLWYGFMCNLLHAMHCYFWVIIAGFPTWWKIFTRRKCCSQEYFPPR